MSRTHWLRLMVQFDWFVGRLFWWAPVSGLVAMGGILAAIGPDAEENSLVGLVHERSPREGIGSVDLLRVTPGLVAGEFALETGSRRGNQGLCLDPGIEEPFAEEAPGDRMEPSRVIGPLFTL